MASRSSKWSRLHCLVTVYLVISLSLKDTTRICLMEKENHEWYAKPGFQPIFVYRGQDNPIRTLRALNRHQEQTTGFSFGSQVYQDRVVIALTEALNSKLKKKTSPFFVDMAANDALHLSNTVRLESEGWNGLCIGMLRNRLEQQI